MVERDSRQESGPLLSVVVPTGDAVAFVRPCVLSLSLSRQEYANAELIFVLDHPTDGTDVVLRELIGLVPDARVIELPEARGAGHARNVGRRAATGRYVAYADADDVVPPGAYAALVGSLEASGSDVATGRAEQFTDESASWPYWSTQGRAFDEPRVGVTLADVPALVEDHTPWNKVYRAEVAVDFPEGTTSEDLVHWARIVPGARVDVVDQVVYRHRRHAASVTGGIAVGSHLDDWITQTKEALAEYRRTAPGPPVEAYLKKLLLREAWTRVRGVAGMGHAEQASLVSFGAWLVSVVPARDLDVLSPLPRASYRLLAAGRVTDLVALLAVVDDRTDDPAGAWASWSGRQEAAREIGETETSLAAGIWRERLFGPTLDSVQAGDAPVHGLREVAEFHDRHVAAALDLHEGQVLDALRLGDETTVRALRCHRKAAARLSVGSPVGARRSVRVEVTGGGAPGQLRRGRLVIQGQRGGGGPRDVVDLQLGDGGVTEVDVTDHPAEGERWAVVVTSPEGVDIVAPTVVVAPPAGAARRAVGAVVRRLRPAGRA